MTFLLELFMNVLFRVLAASAITFSCISLSCISLPLAAADAARPRGTIGLQDALNATLEHNPELAGYEFRLKALEGERQTASLRPELRIATELENVAGSGDFGGVDAGELTLSLSSVIELGGQREARLSLMTARQRQLESSQRLLTLDVLTQVTHQFIRVVAAQEQLNVQQDAHQLAQENLRLLVRQVQAGSTAEAELLRAQAALARADIAERNAHQQLANEYVHLSTFWGAATPDFSAVRADLFALSEVASLAELLAQLDHNPDLALLNDAAQISAAELRQAQTLGSRNLEWNAGIRRIQASDDAALVLGVSMPLGARHRASGTIAAATANQANAELQQDSARIQIKAQLINLSEAHKQTRAEVNSLQTNVLPLLQQAMRVTADAFNRGRYSYLELNLAQRELLDARSALITAAARAQTLGTDIERLTGAPARAPLATAPKSQLRDLP